MTRRQQGKYPNEVRRRTVRLVLEHRDEYASEWAAITSIAAKSGMTAETLRKWVRQAEVDEGRRPGVTSEESVRVRELQRENRELRRANEILKAASGFLRGGARPPTAEMIGFIDAHKGRRTEGLVWGVEPICAVLPIASQTYYAARSRPASARRLRDEALEAEVLRVWEQNYSVYGAPKIWAQLNREGIIVARCTVERLMRRLGIRGAIRGGGPRTTRSDPADERPADLADRDFTAEAPDTKWVADFTYVRTRSGFVYAAFVIDCYARAIVGWNVARRMTTDLVLTALEQAIWDRLGAGVVAGLVCHTDAGAQYLSIRHTERLAQAGIDPSVGSIGDSYDNALAESIIGLYKTELVSNLGPWHGCDDLELETLLWVDWWNHRRLMGTSTPTEKEATYYLQNTTIEAMTLKT
ncbi:MAG: IS3 family transposase [Acidimicrobiia bacterium]|nr:MAG: IS3 family transposase [Acidimicrobiia bacterium]